ncbi:MAG: pseudouridine-5'-phosphate glycosidase [Planctomycetes bacterium]|nr:pseudouridine-5'-phosphate glycosidase [Planctomycetota bacterium]
MRVITRAGPNAVALETTLLTHGVPRETAAPLAAQLADIVRRHDVQPVLVGILEGRAIVGMDEHELARLLAAEHIVKVNTANLGVVLHRGVAGSTTVSATMELCAHAGVRLFATGGIGGLHRGYGTRLDVSSDLAALARFPVAVVCSGVKAMLDVPATREALEALGVPVVGFGTDRFPAFYLRDGGAGVDEVFDDHADLAAYIAEELARSRRGVLVVNPVPAEAEIGRDDWERWIERATEQTRCESGRSLTPAVLRKLHEVSDGRTLEANLALARANTELAASVCRAMLDASM